MSSFYIDGYNLLFSMVENIPSCVESCRVELIHLLDELILEAKINATVIFDNHSPFSTSKPSIEYQEFLHVVFSPKGLCADKYILEIIQGSKNPKMITIVTSDIALTKEARHLGAGTISNERFLQQLSDKTKKKRGKKVTKDGPKEIERLRTIFEERYKSLNERA
jgi:predicted RNA-binding protein with PIN domain